MYKKYARKPLGKRPRRSAYAKKRSTTRKGTHGVTNAVKRFVKRTIHKNIENKSFNPSPVSNTALICASSGQVPFLISVTPDQMSQGTGQGQRIGNQIRPRYCWLKGQVNALAYNSSTNPNIAPITVQMFLFKLKPAYTSWQQSTSASYNVNTTAFFQNGNSTQGFLNAPVDEFLQVNSDYFQVIARKKMTISPGTYLGVGQSGVDTGMNSGYQAPFKRDFYFRLDTHFKKTLQYTDAQSAVTNDNLYWLVQPILASGNSGVTPAEIHYVLQYNYEDA